MAFTYNIQSVVHCRKFSIKQNVETLAVQNSDELIYIRSLYDVLSIWTTRKMHDCQQHFSRTFQNQSDLQYFPSPGIFKKKSRTFQAAWEPWGWNLPNSSRRVTTEHVVNVWNSLPADTDLSLLMAERQSARMSKITNDCLTRSGTGCFIAVPTWQQWALKG